MAFAVSAFQGMGSLPVGNAQLVPVHVLIAYKWIIVLLVSLCISKVQQIYVCHVRLNVYNVKIILVIVLNVKLDMVSKMGNVFLVLRAVYSALTTHINAHYAMLLTTDSIWIPKSVVHVSKKLNVQSVDLITNTAQDVTNLGVSTWRVLRSPVLHVSKVSVLNVTTITSSVLNVRGKRD